MRATIQHLRCQSTSPNPQMEDYIDRLSTRIQNSCNDYNDYHSHRRCIALCALLSAVDRRLSLHNCHDSQTIITIRAAGFLQAGTRSKYIRCSPATTREQLPRSHSSSHHDQFLSNPRVLKLAVKWKVRAFRHFRYSSLLLKTINSNKVHNYKVNRRVYSAIHRLNKSYFTHVKLILLIDIISSFLFQLVTVNHKACTSIHVYRFLHKNFQPQAKYNVLIF